MPIQPVSRCLSCGNPKEGPHVLGCVMDPANAYQPDMPPMVELGQVIQDATTLGMGILRRDADGTYHRDTPVAYAWTRLPNPTPDPPTMAQVMAFLAPWLLQPVTDYFEVVFGIGTIVAKRFLRNDVGAFYLADEPDPDGRRRPATAEDVLTIG